MDAEMNLTNNSTIMNDWSPNMWWILIVLLIDMLLLILFIWGMERLVNP